MTKFSENHQWVDYENGIATIGITAHAVEELGEINFVELPTVGAAFTQDDILCIVESAKAASDILTPIGGSVCEVNEQLEENLGLINGSPETDGWICKFTDVDEAELDSLMEEEEYDVFVEQEIGGDE